METSESLRRFADIVEIPVGRLQRAFKSFDYFETYHDVNMGFTRMWVAILVSAALTGSLFGGIELFYTWLYDKRLDAMTAFSLWGGLGIWIAISVTIVLAVCVAILAIAPLAAGSGVSEVYAALNGLIFPHLFSFKTMAVKAVGLMLTLATGLWVGPEAPMIQIGGSVSLRVGQLLAKAHLSDKEKYDFLCIGGAMGLASAFRAPLSGVTLMIEGFALLWHHGLIWPALCGVWISAYLSNLFSTRFRGGTSLGIKPDGNFPYGSEQDTSVSFLTEIAILASCVFLGIYGAAFSRATDFLEKHIAHVGKTSKIVFTCALCAVTFTAFAGFSHFAPVLFEGPHDLAIIQMIQPGNEAPLTVYVMFFFSVAVQSLLIQFTPLPVGIFAPHIAIGAATGRFFAQAIGGGARAHVVAVCSAGAGLVSYFRFPVTVAVLMTELTSDVFLSIPVLHAIMVTKLLADRLGRGRTALNVLADGKGLPVLRDSSPAQREHLKNVTIGSKASSPVVSLNLQDRIFDITAKFQTYPHLYYPVIEASQQVVGAVLRRRLVHDLIGNAGEDAVVSLENFLDHPPVIVDDNLEFLKAYRLFREKGVRRLVVVDQVTKRLAGILTRSDFYRVFHPP